jgi:hypothetical protein
MWTLHKIWEAEERFAILLHWTFWELRFVK